MDESWVGGALQRARVARLATVGADGAVRLVPICFAVVDGWLAGAVDDKPKRTGQLRRLDDMESAGTATVLVDHYDEDWSQLWWVRVRGRAAVHREARRHRSGRDRGASGQVHAVPRPPTARSCLPDRDGRRPLVAPGARLLTGSLGDVRSGSGDCAPAIQCD
ncbi:MAG: pyridoxamine 5'-phosphate oxidase family protein [Ilumatobacteraceae bacterium]